MVKGAMPSSEKVRKRAQVRIADLIDRFDTCLAAFQDSRVFSGPSLYFHLKTLQRLRTVGTPIATIDDEEFYDWLYATLASWGMHRMGKGATKLRDLDHIKASLRSARSAVQELAELKLSELSLQDSSVVAQKVWALIDRLSVSVADAKIVANTKVLHHLLPDLIPPIDRTYTFTFFYNRNNLSIAEDDAFAEMFQGFHAIASARRETIERCVGSLWCSSQTKVVDNAIVGYVLNVLGANNENA